MIRKLLIANRGEIAVRIMRTAAKLGIKTVAVYSDADSQALHRRVADESIHIGAAPPQRSYLDIQTIIAAAQTSGADAIHPGYGFLSENAEFARACDAAGIVFVGPPADAIAAMGSKSAAKALMEDAGVPILSGYHGEEQGSEHLANVAQGIGYPVLLKASAGGGGKGMRIVRDAAEFEDAFASTRREAMNAFGDDRLLVEKYLERPRHVEVQVFCDAHGNGIYLGDRDCSIQRRHQKVVEEAPAPNLDDALRQAMGEAAVRCAQAIGYIGAGTVEFLLAADGGFYFMEMNTRLQVEHPVTEMVTGQDLVAWQLQVASGATLPLTQAEVEIRGAAVEVRIYAENPAADFLPVTGPIDFLRVPEQSGDLRIDSGIVQGDEVSVHYDPMIAKLIAYGEDRSLAIARLSQALERYAIAPLVTNVSFLKQVIDTPAFHDAMLSTSFLDEVELPAQSIDPRVTACVAALHLHRSRPPSDSPWAAGDGWRANLVSDVRYSFEREDERITVAIETAQTMRRAICGDVGITETDLPVADCDDEIFVFFPEGRDSIRLHDPFPADAGDTEASSLLAPMNGTIVSLGVEVGSVVEPGTTLLIMEAMKMEHAIKAPSAGTLTAYLCQPGDLVEGGQLLIDFELAEEP